tara:strand:+ start:4008 stop:4748 length:741 start_codon:yes stop_codon:yes gene_type:complete
MSEKVILSQISRKRLQKDIIEIMKYPLSEHGIYYIHDHNNMLKGYAIIFGPCDTIYRYGAYCFQFDFPSDYPFSPPKLTYLTNDGTTRFHPNLYRNGKVCISILNTWKGEQWTSCQSIKTVLLTLVTLFHNKPLLNEPGFRETHRSFKPYNKIITYKNLEIAVLRTLNTENIDKYMGPCKIFKSIYNEYIIKNKDNLLKYIEILKNKYENKKEKKYIVTVYNMNYSFDYNTLETNFKKQLSLLKLK